MVWFRFVSLLEQWSVVGRVRQLVRFHFPRIRIELWLSNFPSLPTRLCMNVCVCVFREMFIYISHRHDRRFFSFHPVLFLANINLNGLISAAHSEPFTKILRLVMRRCLYCCAHVRIDLPTKEKASTSSFWYNAGISAGYCRFLWPQTNHGLWP